MCRLYGFHSIIRSGVHHSLVAAENALGQQSQKHPDGWGVAFYEGSFPHLIRNDQKALHDRLFQSISSVVETHTLIAHIRKATVGAVDILNCHPFQHGPWTFAHNGEISGYQEQPNLAERIQKEIDPHFQKHVFGNTDSEVLFHIFLSHLARKVNDIYDASISSDAVLEALKETVEILKTLTHQEHEISKLSFLLSNGHMLIGYRQQKELFYSTHKTLCPERDTCPSFEINACEKETHSGNIKHLIVTSEHIGSGPNVWKELSEGEYVIVSHGMKFQKGIL